MLSLMISLLILLLILAVLYWILTLIIPHLPEPVRWVAQVIFALFCLALVISLFFGSWSFPISHTYLR